MSSARIEIEEPPIVIELECPKTTSTYLSLHAAEIAERVIKALAALQDKDRT